MRNVSIELLTIPISDIESIDQLEEFDPGSERTLAAWLRHASRTDYALPYSQWRKGEEQTGNVPCAPE